MPLVSLIFGDRVADSGNRCRFVLARLHNVYRIARTENSPAAQGIDAMHIEPDDRLRQSAIAGRRAKEVRSLTGPSRTSNATAAGEGRKVSSTNIIGCLPITRALRSRGTGEPISRSSISVLKPASNRPVELSETITRKHPVANHRALIILDLELESRFHLG